MTECLRCGTCCRNYFCLVPKDESSDLNDNYLEDLYTKLSPEEVQLYIEENSIDQGEKCKWLDQEHSVYDSDCNDIAKCTAYSRRSSMCEGHNKDEWCNIGIMVWLKHKQNGHNIPDEIMEIIKRHPRYALYKNIF